MSLSSRFATHKIIRKQNHIPIGALTSPCTPNKFLPSCLLLTVLTIQSAHGQLQVMEKMATLRIFFFSLIKKSGGKALLLLGQLLKHIKNPALCILPPSVGFLTQNGCHSSRNHGSFQSKDALRQPERELMFLLSIRVIKTIFHKASTDLFFVSLTKPRSHVSQLAAKGATKVTICPTVLSQP